MITRFFTTTFSIYRFAWVSEKATNSLLGTFAGHIQQAKAELSQNLGLSMTRTYNIWLASTVNVQEGDTLVSGSDSYSVRAINKRTYLGSNQHYQLIAEKDEDYVSE